MADVAQNDSILKSVSTPTTSSIAPKVFLIAAIIFVVGIGSGYVFSRLGGAGLPLVGNKPVAQVENGNVEKGKIYGSSDEKSFRDSAEGTLQKGGLDGEGSHKLIRPGGDSQTAYLTSSTLSLDGFVGRKVKVWGETYQAQKAGWFMDVGRIQVLD